MVLTNLRIHINEKKLGYSYKNTIFLEDISSIQDKFTSLIIALIVGIFSGSIWLLYLFNFISTQNPNELNIQFISFGVSILSNLLYWLSRKHIVSISSNGGKPIDFSVNNMNEEMIDDFIFKVQESKKQRINFK